MRTFCLSPLDLLEFNLTVGFLYSFYLPKFEPFSFVLKNPAPFATTVLCQLLNPNGKNLIRVNLT